LVVKCPICGRLIGSWEGESQYKGWPRVMRLYIWHLHHAHPERLPEVPDQCPRCDYTPQEPRAVRYYLHLVTSHPKDAYAALKENKLQPEVRRIELPEEVLSKLHCRDTTGAERKEHGFVCAFCQENIGTDEDAVKKHLMQHNGVRSVYFRTYAKGQRVARVNAFPSDAYKEVEELFAKGTPVEDIALPEETVPEEKVKEVKPPTTVEPPEGPEEEEGELEEPENTETSGEEYSRKPLVEYVESRIEDSHREEEEERFPPPEDISQRRTVTPRVRREEYDDEEMGDEGFEPPDMDRRTEKDWKKSPWTWAAILAIGGLVAFGIIRALRSGRIGSLLGGGVPSQQGAPQPQSGSQTEPQQPSSTKPIEPPQANSGYEIMQTPDGKRYIVLPDGRGILPEKYKDRAHKFL